MTYFDSQSPNLPILIQNFLLLQGQVWGERLKKEEKRLHAYTTNEQIRIKERYNISEQKSKITLVLQIKCSIFTTFKITVYYNA